MKDLLARQRFALILFALIFAATMAAIALVGRDQITLAVNAWGRPGLDGIFIFLSMCVESFVLVLLLHLLMFNNYRTALYVLLSFLIAGLVVQLLKNLVFVDAPRPPLHFEGIHDLRLPDGVRLLRHSFPSGHTASAFAVFGALALAVRRNAAKAALLLLALLVGASRVYLARHFATDVAAGEVIGMASAMLAWMWVARMRAPWLSKSPLPALGRRLAKLGITAPGTPAKE